MAKVDKNPCVYESTPDSIVVYDVMGFGCGCGRCDLSENAGRIVKMKFAILRFLGVVKSQSRYRFTLNVDTTNGHEVVLAPSTNGMTEAAFHSFKKPRSE